MASNDALAQYLTEHSDALVAALLAHGVKTSADAPASLEEQQQFYYGWTKVLEAGARGELGPRDEYIAMIVPGLRAAGLPASSLADGMVRIAAVVGRHLPQEHFDWALEFVSDYTIALFRAWEAQ